MPDKKACFMKDDVEIIAEIDKSKMLETVLQFPEQVEEAINLGYNVKLKKFKPKNIVVAGMGGSAISGHIIAAWCLNRLPIPVFVCSDYELPAFVGKDTLVICASYSGNTEETLSAFADGVSKGARMLGLSSGGKLEEFCGKLRIPFIKIRTGMQPRAATAYMLFPMIAAMDVMGIFNGGKTIDARAEIQDALNVLHELRGRMLPEVPAQENPAKKISQFMLEKIPVVFGFGAYGPIAKRWRTQLNENSKVVGWDNAFPELNHNETVGWDQDYDQSRFGVVALRSEDESPQMSARIDFTCQMIKERGAGVVSVMAKGKSLLAKMMYSMYIGDVTSIYLGIIRGIDPSTVDIITKLKNHLGTLGVVSDVEKRLF
jgi:glucose/mannose-6-phosphate isomerase